MENIRNINPIKVDKTTIINLEKGKLPPQALDLEEAVLGAMMIDKKGVDEVIDILQPDAFYKEAHKHIFEAIVQLFTDTQPIDLLTVSAQLKKNGKLELAGGDFYLIQLTQKISSSAHIEFHSRIILIFRPPFSRIAYIYVIAYGCCFHVAKHLDKLRFHHFISSSEKFLISLF